DPGNRTPGTGPQGWDPRNGTPAVKVLRTAEFVPYVVFIEAPGPDTLRTVEESSRIQRGYGHYFDLSLTNDDLERTFGRLRQAMERLRAEPQWVPVSWVY
uniref:Guanylate kinase-like domain-containing protein n=1 Tax=Anser brachyrhynchus TaxID=132585 RepID=A0A8B9C8D2_9AVES